MSSTPKSPTGNDDAMARAMEIHGRLQREYNWDFLRIREDLGAEAEAQDAAAATARPAASSAGVPEAAPAAAPAVEGGDGIQVIRGSGNCRDWNGIHYKAGMSGANVGARQLSMNVATIPPGGVARAHVHVGFEVMLYILQGRVRHEYGPGLRAQVENTAGDFIFIEPGVPHEVFNVSDTEPVVAVVARSDASEWENIVTYDRASE